MQDVVMIKTGAAIKAGIDYDMPNVRCFLPSGGIVVLRRAKDGVLYGMCSTVITDTKRIELQQFVDAYVRYQDVGGGAMDLDIFDNRLRRQDFYLGLDADKIRALQTVGYDPKQGAY